MWHNNFKSSLAEGLQAIRGAGLYRSLQSIDSIQGTRIRLDGMELLNFSSNDYLGLAGHPDVKEAARKAAEEFGAGSGASRLIGGSLKPHSTLEERLAAWKGTEAALTFSSGYLTATGTIGALVGKGDVVILDRLAHSCLVDGARLSGAKMRVFRHNDVEDLERILCWAQEQPGADEGSAKVLVITESVFSMDGDGAPLRELTELKEKYGVWLMIDEAHATGLYGAKGSGRAEEERVSGQIEIQMGTLGKALGAAGGYIAGVGELREWLVNRARSFIFSTAPVPAASAAAAAAVDLARSASGVDLRKKLWANVEHLRLGLEELSSQVRGGVASAIFPVHIGDEQGAVAAASKLRAGGIFVPAIRYPSVGRGKARLRVTVTAAHSGEEIDRLLQSLRTLKLGEKSPDA